MIEGDEAVSLVYTPVARLARKVPRLFVDFFFFPLFPCCSSFSALPSDALSSNGVSAAPAGNRGQCRRVRKRKSSDLGSLREH